MTIDDKIRDGKMQDEINREASKITVLWSDKRNWQIWILYGRINIINIKNIINTYIFSFRKSFKNK